MDINRPAVCSLCYNYEGINADKPPTDTFHARRSLQPVLSIAHSSVMTDTVRRVIIDRLLEFKANTTATDECGATTEVYAVRVQPPPDVLIAAALLSSCMRVPSSTYRAWDAVCLPTPVYCQIYCATLPLFNALIVLSLRLSTQPATLVCSPPVIRCLATKSTSNWKSFVCWLLRKPALAVFVWCRAFPSRSFGRCGPVRSRLLICFLNCVPTALCCRLLPFCNRKCSMPCTVRMLSTNGTIAFMCLFGFDEQHAIVCLFLCVSLGSIPLTWADTIQLKKDIEGLPTARCKCFLIWLLSTCSNLRQFSNRGATAQTQSIYPCNVNFASGLCGYIVRRSRVHYFCRTISTLIWRNWIP